MELFKNKTSKKFHHQFSSLDMDISDLLELSTQLLVSDLETLRYIPLFSS